MSEVRKPGPDGSNRNRRRVIGVGLIAAGVGLVTSADEVATQPERRDPIPECTTAPSSPDCQNVKTRRTIANLLQNSGHTLTGVGAGMLISEYLNSK